MAYNGSLSNYYNRASVNNNENVAPSTWFGTIRKLIADVQPNEEASNTTNSTEEERAVTLRERTKLENITPIKKVLVEQEPQSGLNSNKNIQKPTMNWNTEESFDLTRSIENIYARPTPLFLGLDTPSVTPQKYERPTGVTTSTAMVNPGFASTIATPFGERPAQLQKPIAIVNPSPNNFSLTYDEFAYNSLSSINLDNTREMQSRKSIKTKTVVPYMTDLVRNFIENHTIIENGMEYVKIGTNGTIVLKQFLEQLNWNGVGATLTRKLLTYIFDRQTLATHTITGKPPRTYTDMNKPNRDQLNPLVISDLISFMAHTKGLTARDVKIAISKKCGYECIYYRRHQPAATSTPIKSKTNGASHRL